MNSKKLFRINCILCFLILLSHQSYAQNFQWAYLSSATDKAIAESEIKECGAEIITYSKWLEAYCVRGDISRLQLSASFRKFEPVGRYRVHSNNVHRTQEDFAYGGSDWQIKMLGLDEYHKRGFTGKGVTIGLFDAGFFRVDSLEAFDTLRKRGQIIAEWDFHYNDTNVYIQDGHGMYVLSIAGGYWPDSIMGAAPDANYFLARTEIANREIHLEEVAWIKALEWADSLNVDIIHSSLGYSVFDSLEGDYTYEMMDGESTMITKATDDAWNRGIFVTNSAGNEGEEEWKYITAPCDGKHVLCVGAVDSNEMHAAFSSYGPSADGRVKPEVVAMGKGVTYVNKEGRIKTGSGTSFSGPLIAGMVACLKQAWPTATNQEVFDAIVMSADRYQNPDSAYGYGLPNVLVADSILNKFVSVKNGQNRPGIQIYPNPGNGEIYVKYLGDYNKISVLNSSGALILTQELRDSETIDLTELSAGMYLLRFTNSSHQTSYYRYQKVE